MNLTEFLRKYGSFWIFATMTATLLLKSFTILEILRNVRDGTIIYGAIAIMLLIAFVMPFVLPKIPSKFFHIILIAYFIVAMLNWNVHLWASIVFLILNGIILYPFSTTIMMEFKNQNSSAFDNHYIRLLGIAAGTLFSRVLYFDEILSFGLISIAFYTSGIVVCAIYLIESESEIFTRAGLWDLSENLNDLSSLLFFSVYLLLQSSYLLKLQSTFSFLPYHYYITIQLLILLVLIAVHLKYCMCMLFCPILFVVAGILNFVLISTDLAAFLRLLIEISTLNMLFIFPNLAPVKNNRENYKKMKLKFLKLIIWFGFLIILFGGYFIFPYSNQLYQNIALLCLGILLIIIWIKPRFWGDWKYIYEKMGQKYEQNIKRE